MEIVKVLEEEGKKSICLIKDIFDTQAHYYIINFNGFRVEKVISICENTFKLLKKK